MALPCPLICAGNRYCLIYDPKLQKRIESTLAQMQLDIYMAKLGAHKLEGKLTGLQACSCGYGCRVVFSIEQDEETNQEVIVLLDVGTHSEVY